MKTLTLKLQDKEMAIIDSLSAHKGLSKTGLIKQAIRVYQAIDVRLERGDKLFVEDENKAKAELLLL